MPGETPWTSDYYLRRNVNLVRTIRISFLAANVFGTGFIYYLSYIHTETDLITRVPLPSSLLRKSQDNISKDHVRQIRMSRTKTRPARCFRPAVTQLFPQQLREFLKKGEDLGTSALVAKCSFCVVCLTKRLIRLAFIQPSINGYDARALNKALRTSLWYSFLLECKSTPGFLHYWFG